MTTKFSPREWEAISAYLDGQLAPQEHARLETRLQRDPDLRSAVEEMRRVRGILRSQPKMRAPRNFTLTPQMVAKRPAMPRFYPTFRLASALASLVLVLVLIGDFFAGAPPVPTAMTLPLDTPLSLEAAEMQRNAPPGMGESGDASAMNEKTMSAAAPTTETPTPEAGLMMAQPAEEATEMPPSIAAAPMADTLEAPTLPADSAFSTQSESPASGAAPAPARDEQPPWMLNRSTLRILEGILALLALVSGAVAFYMRRAGSG